MEMHFATVWESIADAIPDHVAITHADTSRTWAEFDERSARFAQALTASGLGPDSKVALYMYNGNEYMEAHYGVFKMRGVAVNVNYRYLDEELWYLLDNSDAEVIVFHSSLADRVARVVGRLPKLKLLVVVDDGAAPDGPAEVPGAQEFEHVVAGHDPMQRIVRSEDDIYMLYTGGTTGMPKGVMYHVGGLVESFISQGFPIVGLAPPSDPSSIGELVRSAVESDALRMVSISCAPLMHGTGCWLGWFIPMCAGAEIVTLVNRSLDPHEVLRTIEERRATTITIVGDSFAKPLVRAIDEGRPGGGAYDLSSVALFLSSGVMWTTEVKQAMLERIEQAVLVDAMGSSEGSMGTQITMKGLASETAKFTQSPNTKVFKDDDTEVVPGSDDVGMVAAGGNVPIGYFKDPEKSDRTFRTIGGVRYSFPGDFAQVAADGTLILLGRGSQVINTGGEKVFPEEVEEAVKRVDGVLDCLVVGVEDEKFGQAVTAVVSLVDGASVDATTVISSVKHDLAGYKAPKSVIFVDDVPRAPNGKADYKTARRLADASVQ